MITLETLLSTFVEKTKEILKDRLTGIYLHGSAAMGCFNSGKSDVDLIIVVDRALPDVVKNAAMPLTQVDKITMYGDGNSSKLVGDIIGSTTKITDGLTEATGIDLRALLAGFLGGKLADTGNTAAVAEAIAAAKKSVEDEYADGEDFSTDLEDF